MATTIRPDDAYTSDRDGPAPNAGQGKVDDAASDVAEEVCDALRDRPWVIAVAKTGWAAKGVVYGAMGYAAAKIGFDAAAPEDDAEYTGIVSMLADGPITRPLLFVIAVGLVFYIAFRALSVLLIDETDLDAWAHRIGYGFSSVTYAAVAWIAAGAAIRGGHESGGQSTVERVSQTLLESDIGRVALGVGSLGALAIAAYFAHKGATRRFMKQIRTDDLDPRRRTAITWSGAIGWVGRAMIVASVSVFVLWSAIQADPSDAEGLDSALHRLAATNGGKAIVLATAGFLLVYAVYCIVSAPYRRLAWSWRHDPDAGSSGAGR